MRVVVEVDVELGLTRVVWVGTAQDVGTAINPLAVEGQIEGGCIYNVMWPTHEDLQWRKGITKANSFSTYLIPTSVDVPDVETVILESGGGLGPWS